MKNTIKNMVMASAVAGILATTASAAVVYTQGDLLMGFRASANGTQGQTTSYVVNLGSLTNFRDNAVAGPIALSLGNVGADLTAIYGAGWETRTDLSYGIIGTYSNAVPGLGDPEGTVYSSKVEAPGTFFTNPGLPQLGLNSSARTATTTNIVGFQTTFAATTEYSALSPGSTAVANSTLNSWNQRVSPTSDFNNLTSIEGNVSRSLSLFRMEGQTTGASTVTYEGSFKIDNAGIVTFQSIPVPEVSTALLSGLSSVLLLFRRDRKA
jgi:hypothetical protein